jgi:hypothetical protein
MSNIVINEAYYGERNNKIPHVVKGDSNDIIWYDFEIDNIEYDNQGIYINYKFELIEDIMYTIKKYYIQKLETKLDLSETEFANIYNNYKSHIIKLYKYILELSKQTEEIKDLINNKIIKLINKPLEYIVYESSWCNEDLLLPKMLRIKEILKRDINYKNIISDIYEYEFSLINNKLINTYIQEKDDNLYFMEKYEIDYINHDDIISNIIDDIEDNDKKLSKLKEIFSQKIYENINNKNENINESKLIELYNCLNIQYAKIVIDMNDYNVVWIMNKLYIPINKYIPIIFIDKKLNGIIQHNINDNIINIKYNKDATTFSQKTNYLINQLFDNLMHCEIHK